ncbi:hypothetical protein V6Z12_D01G099100 [Gossypium hirsutum]|uniref:Uncharacterized protein n=1 Tax=Gossypium darwinii TaxID=34276 RepID=A0A5D2DNQ8_GOSDA|nr:hypothetical protein ES288_D01G107600v1 [Gossypium darwinii]
MHGHSFFSAWMYKRMCLLPANLLSLFAFGMKMFLGFFFRLRCLLLPFSFCFYGRILSFKHGKWVLCMVARAVTYIVTFSWIIGITEINFFCPTLLKYGGTFCNKYP